MNGNYQLRMSWGYDASTVRADDAAIRLNQTLWYNDDSCSSWLVVAGSSSSSSYAYVDSR